MKADAQNTKMVEAALAYAKRGWHIFPVPATCEKNKKVR